ncbi:uncharacterized protein LOC100909061 [Galendromus occidentalis]|uniref:RNA-directed DNA polymerase n=1 Tax=Galendromus occidentalis TaxID=34638 RepID=A0AAJ7WGN6_9ACAR|nr:uncharacterized protein LOC100909061 [Galendromus occidentalis]
MPQVTLPGILENLTKILEKLSTSSASETISSTALSNATSLVGTFSYQPDADNTFPEWYNRNKGILEECVESPTLRAKSLFRRRHDILNIRATSGTKAEETLTLGNLKGDEFEIGNLTSDQFKIFLALLMASEVVKRYVTRVEDAAIGLDGAPRDSSTTINRMQQSSHAKGRFSHQNHDQQLPVLKADGRSVEVKGFFIATLATIPSSGKETSTRVEDRIVVFATETGDLLKTSLGLCTKTEVELLLKPDASPVCLPARPLVMPVRELVDQELDRLVNNGTLCRVDSSDWAAPIVVVRKANGQIRMCADYSTGLNEALQDVDYPLPNMEEIMAKFSGNTVFTQLDLADAYLQLPLCTASRSDKGIQADPSKIEAIRNLRQPKSPSDVRAFLGLLNYYGKFSPRMHAIKAPFEALLKENVVFNWSEVHDEAFIKAKEILTGPLLLAHYDPRQTLVVAADACDAGIGGVLLQRYSDGNEKAVFHIYSQIEKEALALVLTVERLHKFIWGRRFILQTDHRPLVALFQPTNIKGLSERTAARLRRWALRLLGYDFHIEYIRTDAFGHADALSRLISEARRDGGDSVMGEVIGSLNCNEMEVSFLARSNLGAWDLATDFRRASRQDPFLRSILSRLQNVWSDKDRKDPSLRAFAQQAEGLCVVDDILLLDDRVVVPVSLRTAVL